MIQAVRTAFAGNAIFDKNKDEEKQKLDQLMTAVQQAMQSLPAAQGAMFGQRMQMIAGLAEKGMTAMAASAAERLLSDVQDALTQQSEGSGRRLTDDPLSMQEVFGTDNLALSSAARAATGP